LDSIPRVESAEEVLKRTRNGNENFIPFRSTLKALILLCKGLLDPGLNLIKLLGAYLGA
jgi:hypothetical protein